MKYFDIDTVHRSFYEIRACTSNKFWGMLAILSAIDSNVVPGKTYKFNTQKCSSCSNIPSKENLCFECNNGYYEIESDDYLYGHKNCYKDPIGYYLESSKYKKCYYKCE